MMVKDYFHELNILKLCDCRSDIGFYFMCLRETEQFRQFMYKCYNYVL